MDVTIVIPTKNAGNEFKEVLKRIFKQKTKYEYEVICVDSGSTDNTLEIIRDFPVKLYQIRPEEFGHGKTRNYGASKGTGEFIVFLTQDALPVNELWLESFIDAMKEQPEVAGGFGIHYPYPDCNELDKRDLKRHFLNFGSENKVFFIEDYNQYNADKGYQQYLAFFSDNNSCLRRKIWEKIPYQDVNFAEDQIWAKQILEAGYKKMYCPHAGVYHSHNYPLETYFQRYYDEFKGLYGVYQWKMFDKFTSIFRTIKNQCREDINYIKASQIQEKKYWIKYACKRNTYRCFGAYLAGRYHEYPTLVQKSLDNHISQQHKQIHGKKKEKIMTKQNVKEFFKWLILNPEYNKQVEPEIGNEWQINTLSPENKIDICKNYEFVNSDEPDVPFSKTDYLNKGEQLILNWVIPEPGIGGGGHINIFRFVTGLQKLGIHNRVYLMYPGKFSSDEQCEEFLEKYYELDCSQIEVHVHLSEMKFAHGIIATSWQTAYAVKKFNNVISKFYFVQDFEPLFFPVGSEYVFAENTYRFGFRGITAGDWLKNKLHDEYGMETESFSFSYDKHLYVPGQKRDTRNRVFFYARPYTARRAFEFGLIALTKLAKRVPDLEVIFAGEDISRYKIEFKHVNAGIVALSDLSDLYAQCDMCLVLSNTNLSLLPLEVMASNSVAVCTRGAHSDWLVNDDNAIMVDFDIDDVVEKMSYFFEHKEKLETKRKSGVEFAKGTSWECEVAKVREACLKGIRKDEENISTRW